MASDYSDAESMSDVTFFDFHPHPERAFHESKEAYKTDGYSSPNIRDQLHECAISSALVSPNKSFIPEPCIRRIVTPENVKTTIGNSKSDLVDFVCNKAKKIFLILALCKEERLIRDFQKLRFSDDQLPIDPTGSQDYSRAPLPRCILRNQSFRKEFWKAQWQVLAATFPHSKHNYGHFPKDTILPFIETVDGERRTGGFSTVYKVQILQSHSMYQHSARKKPGSDHIVYKALKESNEQMATTQNNLVKEKVEQIFDQEAQVLEKFYELRNAHLIQFDAAFRVGNRQYFIFPWAEGGNLRDFWRHQPHSSGCSAAETIKWALKELRGIAEAIELLYKEGFRHGDLKPENIIIYATEEKGSKGTLVIADVGLAKAHSHATAARNRASTTVSGTQRYEPPGLDPGQPISRLYDIWSIGCLCLEFTIWLLWGYDGLETFDKGFAFNYEKFWHSEPAVVHSHVETTINWMVKNDERCGPVTALGELLTLIRDRLLVTKIKGKSTSESELPKCRADASEMHRELRRIVAKIEIDHHYIDKCARPPTCSFTPSSDTQTPASHRQRALPMYGNKLHVAGGDARDGLRLPPSDEGQDGEISFPVDTPPARTKRTDSLLVESAGSRDMNDVWETITNHDLAQELFEAVEYSHSSSLRTGGSKLCGQCQTRRLWEEGFSDTWHQLRIAAAQGCGLCNLILRCADRTLIHESNSFRLHQESSELKMERGDRPILSLRTGRRQNAAKPFPSWARQGLPMLPPMGSGPQIKLILKWLQICDEQHDCNPVQSGQLPTRVLEVTSSNGAEVLRLFCPPIGNMGRYVALSHRWGSPEDQPPFETTNSTNIRRFQESINFNTLPETFQDAVKVTRLLQIRYLWIDSLCVIQDDQDDWLKQSRLMQSVFRLAYCVIAATRAKHTRDGFLRERTHRVVVPMRHRETSTYYVCEAIDDFQKDVEESTLNKRGWVLQERALSHRTIYFTDTQLYWECGDGVLCETLTKMSNPKSAFLGDAEFPKKAEKMFKGGRIRLYEEVYRRYSRLNFTNITDRSVAISGLETRIIQTFGTKGAYGIFEVYLNRSLLWQRANPDIPFKRIDYPASSRVPTWSWMAYDGEITYVDVPFGKVDWCNMIESPFKSAARSYCDMVYTPDEDLSPTEIFVSTYPFFAPTPLRDMMNWVVFDSCEDTLSLTLRCVLVARNKTSESYAGRCYVLILEEVDFDTYHRIGAGHVDITCIAMGDRSRRVKLV